MIKKIEDIVMHKKARFSIVCHFSGTLMVSVKLCISASGLCTSTLTMIEKYFSALNCLKRVETDDCHKATHCEIAKQKTTQSSSILHKPLGYDVIG